MDPRKLIVALVAALVAGGLVYWSSQTKQEPDTKRGAAVPKQVLQVNTAELRRIELARRDAETTTLESADGKTWRMTSPLAAGTDSDAVSSLLAQLATVSADEIVEEKVVDFTSYGLAQPYLTATLTLKSGRKHVLRIGDDSPVGAGAYARIDDSPRLLLMSSSFKTGVDKFGADLRDRRLITLDPGKMNRVTMKSPKGEVEFSKAGSGDWQISRPAPSRADGWAVEEAIRKLREARFDATLTSDDLKGIASSFASAQPVVTAMFSDGTSTQSIEVRKNASTNKFYAKSPVIEGAQLLAGEALEGYDKTAADYRNKKLFDFGFSEPDRVMFKGAAKEFTLSKSGDKWTSGGKLMDGVGVQSLIDRLRDLSATGFPAVPFPAAAIELHVTSNEGKRLEKVQLGMAGEKWYGRREGDATVFELAPEAVSQLVKAAGDVREAPAAPPPAAKK